MLGPHEQTIARQAYQSGMPLPDKIANAPELLLGLELYIHAFFDLDSERNHGNGLMPIPWSSIVDYGAVNGFDDEQLSDLLHHVKTLDREHLKRLKQKQDSKPKK